MRAWLEDHLLFNLERQFRCANPSRLLPAWLGDASLRGDGSTITTVKFKAVPGPSQYAEFPKACSHDEQEARVELRSLVGRMLWAEVWGSFVEADNWWWDDPDCIEECAQMGTYWEYSLIEAVKDA
jgi:hypothetical protein